MMQTFFLKQKIWDMLAIFSCFLFIVAGILVSINRFWQYEVFYYDFGIFDQAIWNVSRFQKPIIDHLVVGGKWIFADHFSPSIFLLSPLYWFTERSEILLIAQSIIVGLSGFVLYVIGKELLKNRFLSFSILVCYFLFLGLQNAVISDFHEITVITLPLMLTFWAIVKRNLWLYFLFLIITLGGKEVMFLVGVGIGIMLFFQVLEWRKIAFVTVFFSLLWGIFVINYIIPWFSGGIYIYSSIFSQSVVKQAFFLFDHPLKRETLFYSFWSFGFLPLFSPAHWPLMLQDYGSRFLSEACCTRWNLGLHYNAISSVILSISSLYALQRLKKYTILQKYSILVGVVLMLNAFVLYRFFLHGPFALAFHPQFYKHTKEFSFLDKMVDVVPKSATVMTHNNLASRFTHQKVWLLRSDYKKYMPEYIIIDAREGQNPNNFFPTKHYEKILMNLMNDPSYNRVYETKEQFIFQRKKNL